MTQCAIRINNCFKWLKNISVLISHTQTPKRRINNDCLFIKEHFAQIFVVISKTAHTSLAQHTQFLFCFRRRTLWAFFLMSLIRMEHFWWTTMPIKSEVEKQSDPKTNGKHNGANGPMINPSSQSDQLLHSTFGICSFHQTLFTLTPQSIFYVLQIVTQTYIWTSFNPTGLACVDILTTEQDASLALPIPIPVAHHPRLKSMLE